MQMSLAVRLGAVAVSFGVAACAGSNQPTSQPGPVTQAGAGGTTPQVDARSHLKGGLMDAGEASFGLKIDAKAVSPKGFLGQTNSDLTFVGKYAIQGNYNGPVIWDMTNPSNPVLVTAYECPASQNDVSVYKNLMFMSAEAYNGRIDCKPSGQFNPADSVSKDRMRGVRVFDISDIKNPKLITNVQTCRGSHTHTVVEDPKDKDNIYIYVSGSAPLRSPSELPGCVADTTRANSSTSLMRIEIIKVPLAHPEQFVVNPFFVRAQLDSIVKARGGTVAPPNQPSTATAADTAAIRGALQGIVDRQFVPNPNAAKPGISAESPFRQCHDITVYPALGL